jgi:hypothetical protein
MTKQDTVLAALYRGEADARMLDGRDFNARYWQNARRQLSNLIRELDGVKSERDALRACVNAGERP